MCKGKHITVQYSLFNSDRLFVEIRGYHIEWYITPYDKVCAAKDKLENVKPPFQEKTFNVG